MNSHRYQRLSDLIPFLVDEEVGIIGQIISLPRQADMPDFFYYKATVANTEVFGGTENWPVSGGTALDRDRALAKAVGEAVERYSSGIYHYDELRLDIAGNKSFPTVAPADFTGFSKDEFQNAGFPLKEFNADSLLRWSKAVDLQSGAETFVPASMVYCPYVPDLASGEWPIAETISTGLAAHVSYETAALNGLLEVVERDSFMLYWLCGKPANQISAESLMPDHLEMLDRFAKVGYNIKLIDIRSDSGIPTFLGIMNGAFKGSVPFSISAATHLDPSVGILKCLEELALIERYSKRVMLTLSKNNVYPEDESVHRLMDHIGYWLNPKVLAAQAWLFEPCGFISLADIPSLSTGSAASDLEYAVRRVADTGHQTLVADITTDDLEPFGIKVIRAIVPGFLPLNKRHDCRPLDSQRLQRFLKKHGDESTLNPLPHPFA